MRALVAREVFMKQVIIRCLLVLICLAMSLGVCGVASAEGYIEVIPPQYDDAKDFSEGLAAVRVGEKIGFIDKTGKEVVPPRYDAPQWFEYNSSLDFQDGLAGVMVSDGKTEKWGFIDKTGNEVVPLQYEYVNNFCEGLAAVMIGGKWGFIDKTGKEVVPPQYGSSWENDYYFRDGLAKVTVGDSYTGKWGLIDKTGKEIVPPQYDKIGDFYDGLAKVWIADLEAENYYLHGIGKWGFIDKTGREVVPVEYDKVGKFREGRIGVIKDGKLGFVDETGIIVIPPTYAYESESFETMAWYQQDYMPFFSEGLAAIWGGAEHDNQYGFIDRDGNVVIPFMYDHAVHFSEGLAYVSRGGTLEYPSSITYPYDGGFGKYGFIDKTGEVVIPLEYDCGYWDNGGPFLCEQIFYGGYAAVSKSDARPNYPDKVVYGMIDRAGKIVVPIEYDWVRYFSRNSNPNNRLALVGYGSDFADWASWDGCGLVDETGREVVAVGYYDGMESFREGVAHVWRDGEGRGYMDRYWSGTHGFIDTTGKEVVPCIYEDVRDFSEGMAAVKRDGKWGYIALAE